MIRTSKHFLLRTIEKLNYKLLKLPEYNELVAKIQDAPGLTSLSHEMAHAKAHLSAIETRLNEALGLLHILEALTASHSRFPDLHMIPTLLERKAAYYLNLSALGSRAGEEHHLLASYYMELAALVSRHWLRVANGPSDPYPEDDLSIDFARRCGVYRPEDINPPSNRISLPWRGLCREPDCAMILVLGQSNAGNHGETPYTPQTEVYSLDFLRMCCSYAVDPLPGATGTGGSLWSRLGDLLIENTLFRTVIFVPLAFGGTFITDWRPGGSMHGRTMLALSRLRKELKTAILPFSAVLWQQGEAEANHTQMASSAYKMHFHDIVADLRANGVVAPIFVARATICEAGAHPHENRAAIREAQLGLANTAAAIFLGPDMDRVGAEERFDGCHLSESGLVHGARLWFDILSNRREALEKC